MFNSKAVSAAKAVAILLMVVGHAGCPRYMHDYLYMFHMPLFFVMSGYCFKTKYLADAVTFVRRRITGIWWPYVKWGLFFLILHNVFFHLNIYNDVYAFGGRVSHLYTWNEFMIKGRDILRMCYHEQLLGGFWFLKELFYASLIGYLCIRYLKRFSIAAALMIVLMMVFKHTDTISWVPILRLTARTWMATFFFLFGHAWRENEEKGGITSRFDSLSIGRQIGIVVLLAAAVYVIQRIIGPTEMLTFTFESALPYVVGALCGTMMMVYVCRWIVKGGAKLRRSSRSRAGTPSRCSRGTYCASSLCRSSSSPSMACR